MCTWYKKGRSVSECETIILKILLTCDYWLQNAILNTVDAFGCCCVRGGLFYRVSFAICLQVCCCKVCVNYSEKKNIEEQVLRSARFHLLKHRDVQIDFGLQPYLPGSSSFTSLLACQHSPLLPSFPHTIAFTLKPTVLFSVRLSLTVLHVKYLAVDVAGFCPDTSVSPHLVSL